MRTEQAREERGTSLHGTRPWPLDKQSDNQAGGGHRKPKESSGYRHWRREEIPEEEKDEQNGEGPRALEQTSKLDAAFKTSRTLVNRAKTSMKEDLVHRCTVDVRSAPRNRGNASLVLGQTYRISLVSVPLRLALLEATDADHQGEELFVGSPTNSRPPSIDSPFKT
ncbi:hypothetical protein VNO77_19398 [Canavalia gladiata]|uniref:Uncharacterized protein n=1 Tax=Canavalia gladiata TaxID=3824 RepID=A0AAN9LRG5_CANGL